MKKTRTTSATATTAKMKKMSKYERADACCSRKFARLWSAICFAATALLKKTGLDLVEVRIHCRIERIEIFTESIGMINKSLVSYALGAGHLSGQCLKLGIELF